MSVRFHVSRFRVCLVCHLLLTGIVSAELVPPYPVMTSGTIFSMIGIINSLWHTAVRWGPFIQHMNKEFLVQHCDHVISNTWTRKNNHQCLCKLFYIPSQVLPCQSAWLITNMTFNIISMNYCKTVKYHLTIMAQISGDFIRYVWTVIALPFDKN